MKLQKKTLLSLDFTINSSELTMFNQGGKYSMDIKDELEGDIDSGFDKIVLSFQLERDSQSRFDFTNNEAAKHRKQWDEINAERTKDVPKVPEREVSP